MNTNDRDLLLIAVFTFITVSSWIVFEVLTTMKTTTVSTSVQQTITPLSSAIDTEALMKLKERKVY
ncbi:hypothetical protein A2973_01560 [Candidatus Gottesmanbacteria bacterium RIFCSPLOWO2_01_FULL_49_10]|uniref:Uncharacterized protein n=1 Tax=Candidatus Gottesmanbacteria bacterium RIFCSPLOWO2_01_FULL_49_10 TaxID=1798396 RepID=A0A1F6AXV3_9BACT|nr:MAG: hypothetical protein A2973_01560 [Candidatus Gottesmanbacteria bacterium RIFCSPLOWO2_01_FULL_49_10]